MLFDLCVLHVGLELFPGVLAMFPELLVMFIAVL